MSRYLQFPVELACAVGDRKAIVLSQLHYWCEKNKKNNKNYKDNKYWCRRSIKEFKEKDFPFWHINTITNLLNSLKDDELIFTTKLKLYNTTDNTYSYTVNYENLIGKYGFSFNQQSTKISSGTHKNCDNESTKLVKTLKDNNKDNIKDNIYKDTILYYTSNLYKDDSKSIVQYSNSDNQYFELFKKNTKIDDTRITNTGRQVLNVVKGFFRDEKPKYVNKTLIPFKQVRDKLLKLDEYDFEYVCESIDNYTEEIKSPFNFILSILYSADVVKNSYYQNQVNRGFNID